MDGKDKIGAKDKIGNDWRDIVGVFILLIDSKLCVRFENRNGCLC